MPLWYFERWRCDGERAHVTEVTTDFNKVIICSTDPTGERKLAKLSNVERL